MRVRVPAGIFVRTGGHSRPAARRKRGWGWGESRGETHGFTTRAWPKRYGVAAWPHACPQVKVKNIPYRHRTLRSSAGRVLIIGQAPGASTRAGARHARGTPCGGGGRGGAPQEWRDGTRARRARAPACVTRRASLQAPCSRHLRRGCEDGEGEGGWVKGVGGSRVGRPGARRECWCVRVRGRGTCAGWLLTRIGVLK